MVNLQQFTLADYWPEPLPRAVAGHLTSGEETADFREKSPDRSERNRSCGDCKDTCGSEACGGGMWKTALTEMIWQPIQSNVYKEFKHLPPRWQARAR